MYGMLRRSVKCQGHRARSPRSSPRTSRRRCRRPGPTTWRSCVINKTVHRRTSRGARWSRSKICAWIVTSSVPWSVRPGERGASACRRVPSRSSRVGTRLPGELVRVVVQPRRLGSEMPTRSSSSTARSVARLRGVPSCARRASAICHPTVRTGLSDRRAAPGRSSSARRRVHSRLQLHGVDPDELLAIEHDRRSGLDPPGRAEQPQQPTARSRSSRLPDSPTSPSVSDGSTEGETHVVDGAHGAVLRGERGAKTLSDSE